MVQMEGICIKVCGLLALAISGINFRGGILPVFVVLEIVQVCQKFHCLGVQVLHKQGLCQRPPHYLAQQLRKRGAFAPFASSRDVQLHVVLDQTPDD